MNNDDNRLFLRIEEIVSASEIGREEISAARFWIAEGFDDVEEIADWLSARCFSADAARRMENAGITPQQAALLTSAGDRIEDTVGIKVAKGTVSLEEARRIITQQFWNS